MLYEIVFDVVLTTRSVANRPLYEFTLAHRDFRRRVQDVRFTRENAWLTILVEGRPRTLDAYERSFGRGPGTLAVESRLLASGPGFRLRYEKHREPKHDDEETIWHLVALDVGTDARITYDTGAGKSRVSVVHEDRDKLRRFYATLERLDEHGEVRFVRIRPFPQTDFAALGPDDTVLLRAAWEAGYYERPRRTTLRALARAAGMPFTTLGWRLRGLEESAVRALLDGQGTMVDEKAKPRKAAKKATRKNAKPRRA